jgi:predicted acylesterase/phospholipase RssA
MDLILSSGFLAFARHVGVIQAVEEKGIPIDGVCGTSSGAMVGALWAAGHSVDFIRKEANLPRPFVRIRPCLAPWSGLFTMGPVLARLRDILPPRIEDLPRPFGVGLSTMDRKTFLMTSGPLPEAVVASCSIPFLFQPVRIGESHYMDGGFVDRLMAEPWRAKRGGDAIVHIVERSAGVADERGTEGCTVIRTPRSHAHLWDIGDFEGQREEARILASEALVPLVGLEG